MSDPAVRVAHKSVELATLSLRAPWEGFLVRVSGFPLPEQEVEPLQRLLRSLTAEAASQWNLNVEVFIQLSQLHLGNGEKRLPVYGREWIPETGLGVWPDREPPTLWTMEEFESAKPGEPMRPLMYQVFRVTTSDQARAQARDVMLDVGCVLQIMTTDTTEGLLQKGRELLLSPIQELSFRSFPFYVPLLERKSLLSATPNQLESWFCGSSVYIRESFEDKGILIASREPLAPILKQIGGQLKEGSESEWRIPY